MATFYVQRAGGRYEVLCANSDNNNILALLATGMDEHDAIKNARKRYFGNPRSSDKIKVVTMYDA